MAKPLYVGMGPPNAVRVRVDKAADDTDYDPTAVTTATIEVTRPDGTSLSMSTSLSSVSASGLTVTHTLATGDLTVSGDYSFYVKLNVPSGWLRTVKRTFLVED
mgnify:CR=1 FL=1